MSNLVFAAEFDNRKSFDDKVGDYGKITIEDWFGLQNLVELELKTNTPICSNNCKAQLDVEMFQKGSIIDEIRFIDEETGEEVNIKSYEILINGEKYTLGEETYSAIYSVEIIGELKPFQKVDWQIKSNGFWIEEWAIWEDSLNTNLVSFHSFEEGSGFEALNSVDNNIYVLNITSASAPANWVTGKVGGGIDLEADSNFYLKSLSIYDALENENFTISMWLKPESFAVSMRILTFKNDLDILKAEFQSTGTNLAWTIDGVTDHDITIVAANWIGNWRHVVFQYNGSHVGVWINGTWQGSTAEASTFTDIQSPNHFGANEDVPPSTTADYDGVMDEIGIWNRTLSQAEIVNYYNSFDPPAYLEGIVDLLSPTNNSFSANTIVTFSANVTPQSGELTNGTIFVWNSSNHVVNKTINQMEGSVVNTTNFSIQNLPIGKLHWNVLGCFNDSSATTCSFSRNNFTLTYGIQQVFETFNSSVLETSNENFILNLNILSGHNIQKASLIYNTTLFNDATITGSGTNFNISRSITIPQGEQGFSSESRPFFFNVTLANDATGDTTNFLIGDNTQTVNELSFGFCRTGLAVPMLNFTMVNEITNIELNATKNATTFQATFNIGLDADNLVKSFSFSNLTTNASRFNFCTGDTDNVFVANMQSTFSASGFSERNYFLNAATLSNNTNEIDLFMMPDSIGVEFFIDIEQNLFPLQQATINIAKFFVGEGVFKTTEIDMTNGDGKITSFLDLNKDYRFTITKNGELLGIVEKRAICEAAPCTLSLTITDAAPDIYSGFSETFAGQVLYNLSYDGGLKRVNFEFVDITGLATSFRMDITEGITNGTGRLVSRQRLFTSSGSMSFNHTETSGDFTAKIFITRSPDQIIDFIKYLIDDNAKVLGVLGLFVGFLIMITVIFGFAFHPSMLIMAVPLSLTLVKLMQLTSISNGAIVVIYLLAFVAIGFTSR